jgi:putative ATP-binding cassette transporter
VVENMKNIIGLTRNIGFFSTGFDYMIQLIPLLIVVPLYFRGEVEFGAVTQAQIVFTHVMGAFSLIVKDFQRITTFGAVVERLGIFCEVLGEETQPKGPIETVVDTKAMAFDGLTLTTPRDGRLLVKDLSLRVARGGRLLIRGPRGSGRSALLRAAAGLWTAGQGRIHRPPPETLLFLPQQPYLRCGSLRAQLLYATRKEDISDRRLEDLLRRVGLDALLQRACGLDAEQDWPVTLSRGEQQRLAFARLLLADPHFAFLDEATAALEPDEGQGLYTLLAQTPMGYLSVATEPGLLRFHDRQLELRTDGTWQLSS